MLIINSILKIIENVRVNEEINKSNKEAKIEELRGNDWFAGKSRREGQM